MGGPEKVSRHHAAGKLTVRERVQALLDAASFHELGEISGFANYNANGELADFLPANFIFGRGRIDDRPVVIEADDFTVRGGAADADLRAKMVTAEQMAYALRIPLIRLIDGTRRLSSVRCEMWLSVARLAALVRPSRLARPSEQPCAEGAACLSVISTQYPVASAGYEANVSLLSIISASVHRAAFMDSRNTIGSSMPTRPPAFTTILNTRPVISDLTSRRAMFSS
jgi:hypothetical protein